MLSFSVSFFPFLEFCLTACLKLPLLKGRANTLISKLRCHYTGGDLSLGFSRDHSCLLGPSIKLYNTLLENRVAEGVPYLLCRDTYGMETGVFFLFPPTPLTMVPVGFWGREKLEMHFLHSFCWNLCAGWDVEVLRWWCPSWWHSIPEKGKPEFQSLLRGCVSH